MSERSERGGSAVRLCCWVGFPEIHTLSYSFHSGSGRPSLAGRRAGCLDPSAAPFHPSLRHTPPLAVTLVAQASSTDSRALTLQMPPGEPKPGSRGGEASRP